MDKQSAIEQFLAEAESVEASENEGKIKMLRKLHAKAQEQHEFEPGDIIRHKWPEHSLLQSASQPMLFAEYITPIVVADAITNPEHFFNPMASAVLDCKVLVISDGHLMTYFMDSSTLEPHG